MGNIILSVAEKIENFLLMILNFLYREPLLYISVMESYKKLIKNILKNVMEEIMESNIVIMLVMQRNKFPCWKMKT